MIIKDESPAPRVKILDSDGSCFGPCWGLGSCPFLVSCWIESEIRGFKHLGSSYRNLVLLQYNVSEKINLNPPCWMKIPQKIKCFIWISSFHKIPYDPGFRDSLIFKGMYFLLEGIEIPDYFTIDGLRLFRVKFSWDFSMLNFFCCIFFQLFISGPA